jgi:hypothetical protein
LAGSDPLTAIARTNLLMLQRLAHAISPILLPAAAERAIDYLGLAMRARLDHSPVRRDRGASAPSGAPLRKEPVAGRMFHLLRLPTSHSSLCFDFCIDDRSRSVRSCRLLVVKMRVKGYIHVNIAMSVGRKPVLCKSARICCGINCQVSG